MKSSNVVVDLLFIGSSDVSKNDTIKSFLGTPFQELTAGQILKSNRISQFNELRYSKRYMEIESLALVCNDLINCYAKYESDLIDIGTYYRISFEFVLIFSNSQLSPVIHFPNEFIDFLNRTKIDLYIDGVY